MSTLSDEREASLWKREAQDRDLLSKSVGWPGLDVPPTSLILYAGPALRLYDELEEKVRAQERDVAQGLQIVCPKLEWITVVRDEVEGKMVLASMGEGDDED